MSEAPVEPQETREAERPAPPVRPGPVYHGGDLAEARALAGAAGAGAWLDLSTGINPHAYPAAIGAAACEVLPQADDLSRLLEAARAAYRVPPAAAMVAAPGTQAILQWLPMLVPARRVVVLGPTYAEHQARWGKVATVREVATLREAADAQPDVTVVVNPNNPDGRIVSPDELADFAARENRRGALTIVDEAFADVAPEVTVVGSPGTLVLKSFGKFFGLAGLRLGFAIGEATLVARLSDALGPWAVSGPALQVGAEALADRLWIEAMRARLSEERRRLDHLLTAVGLRIVGGTDLFAFAETPDAMAWHEGLAAQRVWTRRFDGRPHHLRFGLPGRAEPRLAEALATVATTFS